MRVNGKRVFLSGPMTGKPAYGVAEFAAAHEKLVGMGAAMVYDPAYQWYVDMANGKPTLDHEEYMRRTLTELTGAERDDGSRYYDVLVQLPEWYDSDGAKVECDVASAIGIEVCELEEVE